MKNTIKNKIAISVFIVFIIGRGADVFATYYHSPDLALETNPIVIMTGYQWSTVFIILASTIILSGLLCARLAKRDYTKPFISEKIAHQVFNKPIKKTAKRRYVDDFYTVLGFGFLGIMIAIYWFLLHTFNIEFASNQLASFKIITVPFYGFVLAGISFGIAYLIGNKVVDKYLPELNLPSSN